MADLPPIEADEASLLRVLSNLIGNAVKFSHDRGRVAIRARAADKELVLSVQDEGIGIPSDALARVFERFSQVDASSTRQHGGTGLGLYITRQLVEAHGGRVWVESEVGRGSTISFSLPLDVAA